MKPFFALTNCRYQATKVLVKCPVDAGLEDILQAISFLFVPYIFLLLFLYATYSNLHIL